MYIYLINILAGQLRLRKMVDSATQEGWENVTRPSGVKN